ncbi:hypothetical protein ACJ41O_000166 [Fusarium nematophilum]
MLALPVGSLALFQAQEQGHQHPAWTKKYYHPYNYDSNYLVALDRWQPVELYYIWWQELSRQVSLRPWAAKAWEFIENVKLPSALSISTFPASVSDDWLESHIPPKLKLFCPLEGSVPGFLEPRLAGRSADMSVVKAWLDACKVYHEGCSVVVPAPKTRLIDCETREVIPAEETMEYLALTYVWGRHNQPLCWSSQLGPIPRTIEDAILVTKALGHRYLWVDRYCVKQDDEADKMEQIRIMDLIYQHAVTTIIVAADHNDDSGIPGVQDIQPIKQNSFKRGRINIIQVIDATGEIEVSVWNSRGWTFQVCILSRRRIVFTETSVYFECFKAVAHDMLGCS